MKHLDLCFGSSLIERISRRDYSAFFTRNATKFAVILTEASKTTEITKNNYLFKTELKITKTQSKTTEIERNTIVT